MATKKRQQKPSHQPFEGRDPHGQFYKITFDMQKSGAWQSLSLRQRGLYGELKSKYRQKVEREQLVNSNIDDISIPESEWRKLYGNYRTFKADMDALIERGFIRVVARGKYTRTPNIYGFTADWQDYGKLK